jgi:molecular chaperone DnaK
LVGDMLESRLQRPAHREINPDLCVAMGAAVQGAIIGGSQVGAVLVDITPHSLGIKCLNSPEAIFGFGEPQFRFAPIVRRGTPLPASRSEAFRTVVDNQETVEIDIYQGEHDDIRRNNPVGMFLIEGLAKVPAGNQIVVQLDMTLDGVLKVAAREKATGLQKHITIDNALARFEREEREAASNRLEDLWRQSFEDQEFDDSEDEEEGPNAFVEPSGDGSSPGLPTLEAGPREGQREAVQARALLEKSERLRDKAPVEDQPELDRLMQNVRIALQDRNWTTVETASNALADILFYLEDA